MSETGTDNNVWVIESFSNYNQRGNFTDSPKFLSKNAIQVDNPVKFCLRLYPKSYGQFPDGTYILLNMISNKTSKKSNEVMVDMTLAFLGANQERKLVKSGRVKFVQGKCIWGSPEYFDPEFICNPANQILHDDKLIIWFEVNIVSNNEIFRESSAVNSQINDSSLFPTKTQTKFITDISLLLTTGLFADISLSCPLRDSENEKNELKAHKCILSTRSTYFADMLRSIEKNDCEVDIEDVKSDVLALVLKYIYSGVVEQSELDQFGMELCVAAEKFQLDSLKEMCEEHLRSKLNTESVISVFLLADTYKYTQLKAAAIEFINSHARNVTFTEQFESMAKEKPQLLLEVYRHLVCKMEDLKENSELKNNAGV